MSSDAPNRGTPRDTGNRRIVILGVVLAIQCAAAVFYVADVASEMSQPGPDAHTVLETLVTTALVLGIGLSIYEMGRTL